MKDEPIPKIEPLVRDLKNLSLGNFLQSNEYLRYLNKVGLEESWRNAFNYVKNNRSYFYVGLDHNYFDSIDAMIVLLNHFYTNAKDCFFNYVYDLLLVYTEWSEKDLYVKNIIEDIKLLSPPQGLLDKIEFLGNYYSKPVPKSEIPENISNAEKLEGVIKQMDSSIQEQKYTLTLTYAYTCLEGLFKAYIDKLIAEKPKTDDLTSLAKIVRDDIKERFNEKDIEYPEQIITLISTITSAISNARNSFSDSHFDKNSDRWLAEFVRDCVHSIGRLVLKLTNKDL